MALCLAALLICSCKGPEKAPYGTFTNPIMKGDYPDPSIVRDGNDYYMTHSSFDYNPGLIVWHSTDLVNWEPISYALQTYLGSVWAPDISKVGDKFYIYFTVHTRGNWVVWADTPYGPWSDPIDLHTGRIDPCIAVGDDGQKWLFLSGGNRVKLTDDGLDTVPESLEHVYDGWPIPDEWVCEGMALEGPKIRKVGDWWYFVAAEGGTAGPPTSHMIAIARSKSIDGPWENSPYNPLVHTYQDTDRWWSRGHGSLIDTPDGRWYVVYHSYENGFLNRGRQTLLEPVELGEDGWWHSLGPNIVEGELPAPLPQHPYDRKARLGEYRIGLDWKYYKDFDPSRAVIKDGVLTLKAQGTDPSNSAPIMFVGGDHAYEFEVEIDRDPGTTAGLVVYYDSQYYNGVGINEVGTVRWRNDRGLRQKRFDEDYLHIWLRLRVDGQVVTGWYSFDGQEWHKDAWGTEISGYNHNVFQEFQSMLPGLVAEGEGYVRFSNFKYRELEK